MWYRFAAWNAETCYGWTLDPAVAAGVAERLNRGRESAFYSAEPIGSDPDEDGGSGIPLQDRGDLLCDDDTMPDDLAEDDRDREAARQALAEAERQFRS